MASKKKVLEGVIVERFRGGAIVVTSNAPKTLEFHKACECIWPVGPDNEPKETAHLRLFCCNPVRADKQGAIYCDAHDALAFHKPKGKR